MSNASPGLVRRLDATGVPLLLVRLFVGGMFAYLAIRKLLDPIDFLKQIGAYDIFPTQPAELINAVAVVLPWLELACAIALLLGVGIRGAALTIIGMLLAFYPALVVRAAELHSTGAFPTFCAVKFDCGCGTGEVFICSKLVENSALLVGALLALFTASRRFCLSTVLRRRSA